MRTFPQDALWAHRLDTHAISRRKRQQDPSDAGLDTLAHQLATHEALAEGERKYVINVSGECGASDDSLHSTLARLFDALG